VEAVVAASDRRGFALARAAAPVLRPLIRRTAGRLWRDDLAYAERRWELRGAGRFPGAGTAAHPRVVAEAAEDRGARG
ncbi:2Fe-2S ferredoxin, partial [Streptomyces sp. SID625]|nr:2Fe-2S ferredoxin [Streptomyces sp. SID625]